MIILIKGNASTGKSLIANALRNNQIAQGNGALLIDEDTEGDLDPLLEKIIAGKALADLSPTREQQDARGVAMTLPELDEGGNVLNEPAPLYANLAEAATIPWKPHSLVILINDREDMLEQFEQRVPGFRDVLGPVVTLTTT